MSRISLLFVLLIGCSPAPKPLTPASVPASPATAPTVPALPISKRLDTGVKSATEFLVNRQSPDGLWRSDVYATFKDGTALTPLVLVALQSANVAPDQQKSASNALAKMVREDGSIDEGPDGLPYPAYTAALCVIALSHPDNGRHKKAREAWLKYLLDRQLTEQNGWTPDDKQYGGWGYYPKFPKKPEPNEIVPAQQLLESNISATRFALAALIAARPNAYQEPNGFMGQAGSPPLLTIAGRAHVARQFVSRCGNPDGGYHFIYDDPVRNKAGSPAIPMAQRTFYSYGSATADGVLATLDGFHLTAQCLTGVETIGDPTIKWLTTHFTPERHPGEYAPALERNRNAVYFYYTAAVAQAFRKKDVKQINGRCWADSLAEALLAKQQKNGSWQNSVELVRENDPILATAYAIWALGECRHSVSDETAPSR